MQPSTECVACLSQQQSIYSQHLPIVTTAN